MVFRIVLVSIFLSFVHSAVPVPGSAQNAYVPVMRISLENSSDHIQVKIVKAFADRLNTRLENVLEVKVFEGARLFRDRDVVTGLLQGKAEMAVPGVWNVEFSVPELGVLLLPEMYGSRAEEVHRLVDGDFGGLLNQRVESALGAHVLGRWIDLGHAHVFTVRKQVRTYSDLEGLMIRVAGGLGNELRIRALGARAVSIAWPDFPARLRAGAVDGVLTTYETVASANLWESGIRYVFEDSQYYPMYIPLVNRAFLERLPDSVREIIAEEWEGSVNSARRAAAEAQSAAKELVKKHGIIISYPTRNDRDSARERMAGEKVHILRQLGIPEDFHSLFIRALAREQF